MENRNKNKGSSGYQSDQDWNRNRQRFNQESDFNQNRGEYSSGGYGYNQSRNTQSEYGNKGYGNRYQGMQNQEDYNRTNYIPDNDENRNYGNRDYENTQYGTSGTYGYRGNYGTGSSQGGYAGGTMGSESGYGQRSWQQGSMHTGDYGDRYRNINWEDDDYGTMESDYRRTRLYGRQNMRRDNSNRSHMQQGQQDRNWWDRTRDEVSSWFGDDDAERRREMDKYYMGGHRGKGPKNYHRSEERIREEVCDRFTDDDYLDATDIEVQVQGNEVILTGNVNSRAQKRRAEDLAETVSGVRNVENRIHVARSDIQLVDENTGTSSMLVRDQDR